jgi:uncharacterized protein YkwD
MRRVLLLVIIAGCAFAPDEQTVDDSVTESQADALTTFSRAQKHNLAVINRYRATKGLVPLRISQRLSDFARAGSAQLALDHRPHGHFRDTGTTKWQRGFRGVTGENQGDPNGWPVRADDVDENERLQIDEALQMMFDEGPGEGAAHGHYENMMSPKFRRLGIGLRTIDGEMYLTNDFSE